MGLERCREMMGWVCSDEEEERQGKEFIEILYIGRNEISVVRPESPRCAPYDKCCNDMEVTHHIRSVEGFNAV